MARLAKKSGKLVVLDIKGRDLKACLSSQQNEGCMPDVIKPNLEELMQTFGCEDDPVSTLERLGCNAVITNGAKGCFVYDHDKGGALSHIDAVKVKSRNTTGCGDAFTATLAYSLVLGFSLEEACRKASISGASKAKEKPFR